MIVATCTITPIPKEGSIINDDFLVRQGASSTYHQHQGNSRVAEVPRRLQQQDGRRRF